MESTDRTQHIQECVLAATNEESTVVNTKVALGQDPCRANTNDDIYTNNNKAEVGSQYQMQGIIDENAQMIVS